jgi:hypothetical protein
MKTDELVNGVLGLEDEKDVTRVLEAAEERLKQLRAARNLDLRQSLRIGKRVELNNRISPKYLQGLKGAIAAPPGDKWASVKLDQPGMAGRFAHDDGTVHIAFGALDLIDEAEPAPAQE